MKEVAAAKKAPVIDLFTASKTLVEGLGPEKAAAHANKPGDNTHFNETGAAGDGRVGVEGVTRGGAEVEGVAESQGRSKIIGPSFNHSI